MRLRFIVTLAPPSSIATWLPTARSVMHAELMLGNSRFFLHDEFPEHGEVSPLGGQATGVKLHLYVDDVDDMFRGPSRPAPPRSCPCRTVSGEIGTASSSTRSATAGRLRLASKTSRPASFKSGPASSMPSIPPYAGRDSRTDEVSGSFQRQERSLERWDEGGLSMNPRCLFAMIVSGLVGHPRSDSPRTARIKQRPRRGTRRVQFTGDSTIWREPGTWQSSTRW